MKTTRIALLAGALLCTAALAAPAARVDEFDDRAAAMVAGMTLTEKLAQISVDTNAENFPFADITSGVIGNIMNFGYVDAEKDEAQAAWLRSPRRLRMLDGIDMEYGFRTLFPVPIAQAATFDLASNREAARLAAQEAVASGVDWTFGPMVDLSRDQRWGRMVEGAGEDVLLSACMAGARTRGAREGGQFVSLKHFAAHGFPEGGREYGAVEMSETFLRDVVLPPFRTGIAAGADMVMAAFNTLNGVPVAASRHLLRDLLRDDLGFRGPIVSDWESIAQMARQGLSEDPVEIVARSITAGVDMDMASGHFRKYLPEAVRRGLVTPDDIDVAARRVVRMKLARGLDGPSSFDPAQREARVAALAAEARRVAIESARKADVLLQNRGDLLPLAGVKRIAVVGGLADDAPVLMASGPARGRKEDVVTLKGAIAERAARSGIATDWIEACIYSCLTAAPDDPRIREAAARAGEADVAIVVVGENRELTGEATSRTELAPSPGQLALIRAVAATGKPVVVLLVGGRAQVIEDFRERVGAILMVWFPGTHGSIAAAEILFGDITPSGRLPFTWPRSAAEEPLSYDELPTARPAEVDNRWTHRYVDRPPGPRHPFGFGLTTSKVDYGAPRLDRAEVRIDDVVTVRVAVTNSGRRAVREVVQAYARDLVASRTRPLRRLAAFAAVELAPGETKDVALSIRPIDLGFHIENGHWIVEAGTFRLFVGADAEATAHVDVRLLDSADRTARDEPVLCLDRVLAE